MKLTIVSPEKTIYSGEILSVIVPGAKGMFEVLENHAPIISSLQEGVVAFNTTEGENISFAIRSGFVEVAKNEVSVCAEI